MYGGPKKDGDFDRIDARFDHLLIGIDGTDALIPPIHLIVRTREKYDRDELLAGRLHVLLGADRPTVWVSVGDAADVGEVDLGLSLRQYSQKERKK